MAFGAGNTIGTGVGTAAGTTTTITTSAATAAGDFVVVYISKDNTGTTDAESNEVTSVTDSAGNVYRKDGEYRNSAGAANDGVVIAVFSSKHAAALSSGGTITITHDSVSDRAAAAWKFTTSGTIANGWSVGVEAVATPVVDDATAHGTSISISSGLKSAEYLFFRATGVEDEAFTTRTATASHTLATQVISTTSGANAANTMADGEFRILTGTSDTSNPTFTTAASTQGATLFFAYTEYQASTQSWKPSQGHQPARALPPAAKDLSTYPPYQPPPPYLEEMLDWTPRIAFTPQPRPQVVASGMTPSDTILWELWDEFRWDHFYWDSERDGPPP